MKVTCEAPSVALVPARVWGTGKDAEVGVEGEVVGAAAGAWRSTLCGVPIRGSASTAVDKAWTQRATARKRNAAILTG